MKKVKVRAVVIHGPNGYTMHGSHDLTASDMFKMLSGVWKFDPEKETVHYVEVEVKLPQYIEARSSFRNEDGSIREMDSYPDEAFGWGKVIDNS